VTLLAAARVLNGEGGTSATPAWVVIDGGRIVAVGAGAPPADAGPVDDLGDALLAPGFLDLQVNGAGAVDFATADVDAIVALLDERAVSGCTGCLPTLVTAPLDAYPVMLGRLAEARDRRPDLVLGVHLEGPFLGAAPGAHPTDLIRPVDVAWLEKCCADFGDLVRVVTLAPEADPDLVATRMLAARGIVVALGHSTVDDLGARRAADAGARMVTHVFNGMGSLHHRAPGLPGAALDDERLVPSIIVDGVHVHPVVVRLVLRARPDAVLVTDAVATNAPVVERDGAAYLPDGTLNGSTITMADAVRNVASFGGPAGRVVRHATANPARVIGLTDRGRLAPGTRADLVALDPQTLQVRRVWLAGSPLDR
jgi:N-acetylglucosamine-6-phosphate deacetylase